MIAQHGTSKHIMEIMYLDPKSLGYFIIDYDIIFYFFPKSPKMWLKYHWLGCSCGFAESGWRSFVLGRWFTRAFFSVCIRSSNSWIEFSWCCFMVSLTMFAGTMWGLSGLFCRPSFSNCSRTGRLPAFRSFIRWRAKSISLFVKIGMPGNFVKHCSITLCKSKHIKFTRNKVNITAFRSK